MKVPFQVGDIVRDSRWKYTGVVAFLGPTTFDKGTWVGLLLNTRIGTNDGSVKGVSYFKCDAKQGKFLKPESVRKIQPANPKSLERASQSSIDVQIHEQPQAPENILYGTSVTICIKASGPGILSYQWVKDEIPIMDEQPRGCSGMKSDTIIIESLQPEHCGEYSCVVRSQDGRFNSTRSSIIALKGTCRVYYRYITWFKHESNYL